MEIPMPGGRSEVFRDSGGEAGCLSEERTSPRPVGGIGQGRAARAVEEREGGASGAESRCRNGAGADGIRVRTSASIAELGPGRIFDADTLARRP